MLLIHHSALCPFLSFRVQGLDEDNLEGVHPHNIFINAALLNVYTFKARALDVAVCLH